MATDDQSSSSHELPYLVYHTSEEDGDLYFDIQHRRCGKKNIPWFRNRTELDTNSGQLLQFSFNTGRFCLLRQRTGEELPIPDLPEPQTLDCYFFRLCAAASGWHVVAIDKRQQIYLWRPGRTHWDKFEFSVPKPSEDSANWSMIGAAVSGGKIYVLVGIYLVVISNIGGTVRARCNETRGPYGILNVSLPNLGSYSLEFLLESDGDLYKVSAQFVSEYESRPRTVIVMRLNRSANHCWEFVSSIGNKVFLLGEYYCAALPAPSNVHGEMVYFSHGGNTCAFNVRSRCLTAYFHCQHQLMDGTPPSWLLLEEDQYEEVGNDHEEIRSRTASQSSLDEDFGHPVNISTYLPARNLLAKKGGVVIWCPKTPWLLIRHGHDSTLKFFDPCSSCVYALDVPELSDKSLYHSRDGWVLASTSGRSWFFFNPFTKQKIDLPAKLAKYCDRIGVSLSPASPDCLVFTINNFTELGGMIILFSFATNALTPLSYPSSLLLDLSSSSPVYHNGLFYCLAMNGNLGVYDPTENSWTVKNKPFIAFDAFLVRTCFLIESDSKLFSVFMDEYDIPIGVFCLDSDEEEWIEVKDMMEKTIFLGKEASFIVPAPEKRMANKIYLPVFKGESGHELRSHDIGVDHSLDVKSFTIREYLSIWIEPKGVIFELDQTIGRFNHPTIRLRTSIDSKMR